MPEGSPTALGFDCDWQLGLNLSARTTGCIGYLLGFNGLGGLKLDKDIEVWNPIGDDAARTIITKDKVECIGLIQSFRYEGGDEDPIQIRSYVSKGSAANVRAKLARPLANTSLKVAWYIIDFDSDEKKWFEASYLKSPKEASSNVDSAGGELQLFVSNDSTPVSESLNIGLFKLEFQIVPSDGKSATLEFATGPRRRLVKKWGS
ncbi:MAG: hypothetical protein AAFZ18_29495 [Myxococcota bacterium]